jgi:CTP synthase
LSAHDVDNLFHGPRILQQQKVIPLLTRILMLDKLETTPSALFVGDQGIRSSEEWNAFAKSVDIADKSAPIVVAFVGKYNEGGGDAYQSVIAALHHSAVSLGRKLQIEWIDATELQPLKDSADEVAKARLAKAEQRLKDADGVFVPGGFGDRGVEGKVRAASLARVHKKPYLGVCLGMQVAIIAFARDVLGLDDATSEEFDKDSKRSKNHVLKYMPEISRETMGANMRLGERWVEFPESQTDTIASSLYGGSLRIKERHRHRYEFNIDYKQKIEERGLLFSAQDEMKERMDAIELPLSEHPFYFAVQYHPEYKSRPRQPSPPYFGFMAAASKPDQVKRMLEECRAKGPNPHWTPFTI